MDVGGLWKQGVLVDGGCLREGCWVQAYRRVDPTYEDHVDNGL